MEFLMPLKMELLTQNTIFYGFPLALELYVDLMF
jgi:hypothetical protein